MLLLIVASIIDNSSRTTSCIQAGSVGRPLARSTRWRDPDPCRRGSSAGAAGCAAVIRVGQRVAQPVQRLDNPHRRPVSPEQLAWRRRPERDDLLAELDRAQAGVGVHDDPARHGIAEAEIVGGCHAIDQHPGLIAPRHGLNHPAIIRDGHLPVRRLRCGRS